VTVTEVMFSASPNSTRSDKPTKTIVSRWRSGQTSKTSYIKASLSSHHTSGNAETFAKLQSANWKWEARGRL